MKTINLRIDVSALDKGRFKTNEYERKDGTLIKEVNADLVVIPKKEHRVIKQGETWVLKETHFVVEKRDKDEEPNYVGTGTQFFDYPEPTVEIPEVAEEDLPF